MLTRSFAAAFACVVIGSLVVLGGLIAGLAGSAGPARAALPALPAVLPVFGPDIQVSPPVTESFLEKNISVAVNPTDPTNLIAGSTTSDLNGSSGHRYSTDSGYTWAGGNFSGPWGGSEALVPYGDSRVAFDGRGVGYYSTLAIGSTRSAYYVLTTTNGITWSDPLPVIDSDYSVYRFQSDMTVDQRLSGPYAGSIYMAWIRTVNANPYVEGVQLTYSRDGGLTWSPEIMVSDPGHEFSYAPSLEIASDGSIYASFEQLDNYYIGNQPKLYVTRSTDGGQTWGPDMLVGGQPVVPAGRLDWKGRELVLLGGPTCNLLRINHFPTLAISPTNPNDIYVAWNDGSWEPAVPICDVIGRHGDIAFSRSTDGGNTWSPHIRINDDPVGNEVDQFQPILATAPSGTLGITWYDRRYDPNGYLYDTLYSQSTDGGVTWSPNQRISDVSSDPDNVPDYKTVDDLGSRHPLVFGPDYVQPGWFDTRQGPRFGLFFTDHGVYPALTQTPTATPTTPVSTNTPTSTSPPTTLTPTATPTATGTPCTLTFSDVNPGDYFYEAVMYLACHGVISGYSDGTFRPYNDTTRGQLSKIIVLARGWPIVTPTGTPTFQDVPADNPFYGYIETAYAHQIISGYSCGTGCLEFRWANNITRGQLTKVVVLAMNWAITPPSTPTFIDVPLDHPFFGYIETAYAHQIISGYSCGTNCLEFRPYNNATRGQIAKIVYQAIQNP